MDDSNKRIDNVDKSCCGCEETVNPIISGDCPGSLEHMTNWRTEHTRIRLPEDNFAFPVESQKINPNDCNCDPVVASCCTNLDDLPDKIYANFYVDTAIGNEYPLLKPQEGRLGQFHFYSPTTTNTGGFQNYRYFHEQGRIAPSCFVFSLNQDRINLGEERQGINRGVRFDLKQILETVGGSLDEDLRYVDKFTVELLRDRTFDSSVLPQNISDVRYIHDLKETLGEEAANYRDYYLAECPPTGTVISKKPYLDIITDIDPCAYAQLRAVDCIPKMVWTAKVKTPGGRNIQVVHFCDGKDSVTGANTFKTMIFHLDSLKNEWGSFKERDFWNLFEKWEPQYDDTDWWLWHKERDWSRFLNWSQFGDQWYLDPNQDYRLLQNINYIFTVGYAEWITVDTANYYFSMHILCKRLYEEYCSPRGFFLLPPGRPDSSFQLDGPFQATTVRQASPFFEVDKSGDYLPRDSSGKIIERPSFDGLGRERYLGTCNYHTLLNPSKANSGIRLPPPPWVWDDDWQAANYPQGYPYPYLTPEGFTQWSFESLVKYTKGIKLGTVKSSNYRTFNQFPTSEDDYKCEWDVSWTKAERIDTVYNLFAATHKRANYPFGVLYPDKAPLLLKLFGNGNCPYIQPSKYRDLSQAGKVDFTIHSAVNGVMSSHKAHAECVVYRPYYSPPFWNCDIRYTLNDLPVEEQPARAKIHCPKFPEEFLDENHHPIAEFPNGKYPMHLFATVSKDFIKASGRNNQRHRYFAETWDPVNEKGPIKAIDPFDTIELIDNVKESGGVDYFTPKSIRGKYTDLFYRLDFLGATGPPENLSLHYGKWYNDEQSRFESAWTYYNTPSHLLWLNTPQLFSDIEVTIRVTSTYDNIPANSIVVYSPSETKTGYPGGHKFTGQDIECPYISFPLIVNKQCDTYIGPDCDYFPYLSPIGEMSEEDTGYNAPGVITLAPKGGFQLVIKSHSDSWSLIRVGEFESGLDYIKCGFNNPYYGTYIKASLTKDIGVIGGSLRFRGTAFEVPNVVQSRLDAFDCDESDLQALWLEGLATFPYSQSPFPNLDPPENYCDGSTKPFYINGPNILYPTVDSYAAAGDTLFPFRKQLTYWPTANLPCTVQAIKNLAFGEGFGLREDTSTMRSFSVTHGHWSLKCTSPVYSDFIYNDVESAPGLYSIWNQARTQVRTITLKAPNITQATESYNSATYWETLIADNLAYLKASFEEPFIRCDVDTEGTMPPLYHYVNYTYQFPSELKQIQNYDTMEGYVTGGDGQPHPYTREYTVLNYYDPVTLMPAQNWVNVNETRTLSEITVPKYIYPHEYYFKCTISS